MRTVTKRIQTRRTLLLVVGWSVLGSVEALECPSGWGNKVATISDDQINDGYCDCPTTGQDEPETEACSGLDGWAGNNKAAATTSSLLFACPQQPNFSIAHSKVHDGICDCCDGADEWKSVECPDICDQVLASERAAVERMRENFEIGSAVRLEQVEEFKEIKEETGEKVQKIKADLFFLNQELDRAEGLLVQAKNRILDDRLDVVMSRHLSLATHAPMAEVWDSNLKGLLEPLSDTELQWLIIHACQLAGEMSSARDSKTCVPLRLAGLDASLVWQQGTYAVRKIPETEEEGKTQLAQVLQHNLRNIDKIWNFDSDGDSKTRSGGRRLEDDDYMYDDYDEDDEDEEEYRRPSRSSSSRKKIKSDDDEASKDGKREELLASIKSKAFSQSRLLFLEKAEVVRTKIDEVLKEEEKEDEEGDATPPEEAEELDFDPTALPAVKSKLASRERLIQRGFDYAVSARVLMDKVTEFFASDPMRMKYTLYPLAMGVLNHGGLSTLHYWELLRTVVPESAVPPADSETCLSPLASKCPALQVERSFGGELMPLPPTKIVELVTAYCEAGVSTEHSEVCAVSQAELPSDVPDGYAGYYSVEKRSNDDLFQTLFADIGLVDEPKSRAELTELEKERDELEKDKKKLEKELKDLEKLIGGKDAAKYGTDGELYAIREECFSIDQGKYTYELCMFKNARQKEEDQKGRGTDLGKWMETTFEDGQRVWKWGNGQKCWNGPKRSATALVTCGAETRVLSADEPDTCRYVLEVESPVACDEAFRVKYGL